MTREPRWLFPPVDETPQPERRVVLDGWIRRAILDTAQEAPQDQEAQHG